VVLRKVDRTSLLLRDALRHEEKALQQGFLEENSKEEKVLQQGFLEENSKLKQSSKSPAIADAGASATTMDNL